MLSRSNESVAVLALEIRVMHNKSKMLHANRNTVVAYSFRNTCILFKFWFNVKKSQMDCNRFLQPDSDWFQLVYSAWTRYDPVYSA